MISEKNLRKAKNSSLIEELDNTEWSEGRNRPISSLLNAYVRPPNEIEVRGRYLYWEDVEYPTQETSHFQMDAAKIKQLLNDFLNLAEATDQKIEKFARRWGVIGLCAHGLPYHHLPLSPPRYPRYVRDYIERTKASFETRAKEIGAEEIERIFKRREEEYANTRATDIDRKDTEFWIMNDLEKVKMGTNLFLGSSLKYLLDVQLPQNGLCGRVEDSKKKPVGDTLESYRHFAQEAAAIIELARDLREGLPGQKKHWERILYNWDTSNREPFELPEYVGEPGMQYSLSIIINHWLEMTGVRPGVMWMLSDEPTFTLLGSTSLFKYRPGENILAFVALQIMLMVTRRAGFGRCAFCGDWFDLEPSQSASRGCYCPSHRDRSYYDRVSARTYRQRNRTMPDRAKRTRLTSRDYKAIRAKWGKSKKTKAEFCQQMAKEYQRSERQIRNILGNEEA